MLQNQKYTFMQNIAESFIFYIQGQIGPKIKDLIKKNDQTVFLLQLFEK
jgi:hypothetical protein